MCDTNAEVKLHWVVSSYDADGEGGGLLEVLLGLPALIHVTEAELNVLSRAAALHVHLELVLAGKGLVAGRAGEGPLPGVEELVPVHVLGPCELFAANVAGILVMGLRAVGLEVLGQLARLAELLAALEAGVDPGPAAAGPQVRLGPQLAAMLLLPVPRQPALRRERLVASLKQKMNITHSFSVIKRCKEKNIIIINNSLKQIISFFSI